MKQSTYAERLRKFGITNGRKLADHVKSPAVIYFLTKDKNGNTDLRAELHFWAYDDEGEYQDTEIFRPGPEAARLTLSAIRQQLVEEAKIWAARELEMSEGWHKAPFDNCWLPREAIDRMRALIDLPPLAEVLAHNGSEMQ